MLFGKINFKELHRKRAKHRKWLRARDRSEKQAELRRAAQLKRRERARRLERAHAIVARVKRKKMKRLAAKFIQWREEHAQSR